MLEKNIKHHEEIIKIPMKYVVLGLAVIICIVLVIVIVNAGIFGGEKKARENLMNFFAVQIPDSEVQIVSSSKQGSFYQFVLNVDGETVPVYVSSDGKYMTIELMPLE